MRPFLTFYTPTFQRPSGLATCMASVAQQTAAARIEHLVIPDYIGVGIDGMFARVPLYAHAVHGQYVHILGDDDQLADPEAVAEVQAFAEAHDHPPLILVRAHKGPWDLPGHPVWPPVLAQIDLGCIITRADIWRQHCTAYGKRYEGDFDYAEALAKAGIPAAYFPRLFVVGGVGRGVPEASGPISIGWSA